MAVSHIHRGICPRDADVREGDAHRHRQARPGDDPCAIGRQRFDHHLDSGARLAVNNLVWPALFNVFAMRGGEYRDPRVVLSGLDHLRSLDCAYLLGAHGPPLSGKS